MDGHFDATVVCKHSGGMQADEVCGRHFDGADKRGGDKSVETSLPRMNCDLTCKNRTPHVLMQSPIRVPISIPIYLPNSVSNSNSID